MEEHLQVAIGSVLGDGHLRPFSKRGRTSKLYISQRTSKLAYLEWLHSMLGCGFAMKPIRKKKGYAQYCVETKPERVLGDLRLRFYPNGKKAVPNNIGDLLVSPLSLAVWYMDDGTLDRRFKYHFNSMFATYGFSFEDCKKLAKTLVDNFGVEASVSKCKMRSKMYPRLYIKSCSMVNFMNLISPYVHPVFQYKVFPYIS